MKKISHIWSIFCTSAITDQDSNNMTLFDLVEKYSIKISKKGSQKIEDKNKLLIPFNREIVSRFMKVTKNKSIIFDLRVDIIMPTGKAIESKDTQTINFDKKLQNIRIKNKIGFIPVEGSGLYYFSVKTKEVGETRFIEVAKIPIEIDIEFEK